MFNIDQDFSQYGEQRIILDFFARYNGKFNAYCVDVGAYDGIVGSNSRALFLNSWRGVVIEPNPRTFARLQALYADRPDIKCIQKALSDVRQENRAIKFATGPVGTAEEDKWKYAQVSTLHDVWAASYEKEYGYVYETLAIDTDTLTNVLREVAAPRDIGFLSIDCEGEDVKIVREFDLERFRPQLICVEADENNRHVYAEIIEPRGYLLHSYTVANVFFERRSPLMRRTLKQAAMLVPSIRRLKEQRDTAIQQVSDLSRRLQELEGPNSRTPENSASDSEAVISRSVERALEAVRAEYTPLPRFAYHLPLDYEVQTLPPRFEPAIWIKGEPLPLPPSAERHGHFDDQTYLDWGRYDHDIILGHVRKAFASIENLALMDFGCSSGRVLGHFLPEMREHGWTATGVDVSARRIEWMRRNFPPEFQVYTGSVLPILPFESNTFDVIYGLSVFTHLKFLWDMWLLELRRVLKPGGLLIQSIHTENAWEFFARQGDQEWVRASLGPMIISQKQLPDDYVYFGDIGDNKVFWKKDVAIAFWGRYFKNVTVFPPPEKYWYQDWIVGKK